jgi:hypothetical protein
MNYIEVEVIEEATHWMSLENKMGIFTFGKLYKLILRKFYTINAWNKNIVDEDFWVKNDLNQWHQPFGLHNGKFIKVI